MRRRVTAVPPPPETRSPGRHWEAACAGLLPAEMLSTRDREDLVYDLWASGWTDLEIAMHTRLTTYTTGRIRARHGLAAHQRKAAV